MLGQMENKVTVTVNGKEFDITKKSELKECIIEVEKSRDELANENTKLETNGIFGYITNAISEQLFNALDAQINDLKKIYDDMPDEDVDEAPDEARAPEYEVSEDGTAFDWTIVDWNDPAWRNADDYLTDTFGAEYDNLPDEKQYQILKTVADAYKWLYANM